MKDHYSEISKSSLDIEWRHEDEVNKIHNRDENEDNYQDHSWYFHQWEKSPLFRWQETENRNKKFDIQRLGIAYIFREIFWKECKFDLILHHPSIRPNQSHLRCNLRIYTRKVNSKVAKDPTLIERRRKREPPGRLSLTFQTDDRLLEALLIQARP